MAASSETPALYDQIADLYEAMMPDAYDDPQVAGLFEIVGDVANLRLLDIACGQGRITRELERRGAHVTGADISAAMLDKGRAIEQANPLGIQYIHANISAPDALQGETFDGVTCCFGLSDIDDLDGAIATVAAALKPGGFFAFVILHPAFPGWPSASASSSWPPGEGYYAEGRWFAAGPMGGLRPRIGANHRTLSTYLNTFARHNLIVEQVSEPQPSQEWLESPPSTGPVPVYLVMRYRKAE